MRTKFLATPLVAAKFVLKKYQKKDDHTIDKRIGAIVSKTSLPRLHCEKK